MLEDTKRQLVECKILADKRALKLLQKEEEIQKLTESSDVTLFKYTKLILTVLKT